MAQVGRLTATSGEPIEAISPAGIRARGQEYTVDAIVFATGFDAMTGALLKIDIRGTGGQTLTDKWREGPKTYLRALKCAAEMQAAMAESKAALPPDRRIEFR